MSFHNYKVIKHGVLHFWLRPLHLYRLAPSDVFLSHSPRMCNRTSSDTIRLCNQLLLFCNVHVFMVIIINFSMELNFVTICIMPSLHDYSLTNIGISNIHYIKIIWSIRFRISTHTLNNKHQWVRTGKFYENIHTVMYLSLRYHYK